MVVRVSQPWNANLHYDKVLLALTAPTGGQRVLDVGCGDGFLSAALVERGHRVTGLDADAPVLARARERWGAASVDWVHADLMTADLAPASFDAVVSNATLHHLPDTRAALRRMAELLRPGGRLGIVGFARNSWWDWPYALAGQATLVTMNRIRRKWEHTAPQHWPPPLTYREVHRAASDLLPNRRFRRLLYGRYLLTWGKP